MSYIETKLAFNERDCEYDYYGDTRNNTKHNEEKPYAKNSYNFKINKKIKGSILKKEMQKEEYEENKQKKELEKKESEKDEENKVMYKNERKRKLKYTEEEDENFGNNFQEILKKPKKSKRPRKDRIRF